MDQFKDVSEAELAVLQVLWDRGSATIREITDALYPGGGEASYATVQKLLERLEVKKGHVARDRSGHAHRFRPLIDRDTLVGYRLRAVAEQLTGGVMAPLLTHLVRAEALSSDERQELRALIDELDRKKPRK
jgi:predicted transcriptional regulator